MNTDPMPAANLLRRTFRRNSYQSHPQGPVCVIIRRDYRLHNQWAVTLAVHEATKRNVSVVIACLIPGWLAQKNPRQYLYFTSVHASLKQASQDKQLTWIEGKTMRELVRQIAEIKPATVLVDFDPHHQAEQQLAKVLQWADLTQTQVIEVDSRNSVPARLISQKQEVGARTLRPKHARLLPEFLGDQGITDVVYLDNGAHAQASNTLRQFVTRGIVGYDTGRNDPNQPAQSGLSALLHFGVITAHDCAVQVTASTVGSAADRAAFLEEVLVRRELADNSVLYATESGRTGMAMIPNWATVSLQAHAQDPRDFTYTYQQFYAGETHDPLWNAAQKQLRATGKMHGYLRMYWAKKILEWTESPDQAYAFALRLNDSLSIDGNDSNGDIGVLWSIGGLHDRPWFDRSVYGVIRYMNANGAAKKFNVPQYIAVMELLREPAAAEQPGITA
jgi:deoxyribodipyrimidine photo-lyase